LDSSLIGGLIAVGAVVLVALVARAMQRKPEASPTRTAPSERWAGDQNVATALAEPDEDDDAPEDDEGPEDVEGHVIAVTTLGEALVPHLHAVRLVPPEEQGEAWKVGAGMKSVNLRGEQALAMSWHPGDFTGVRVVRGEADEGAWRVEALGREGEYTTFFFETRDGADAARLLFERLGVVRLGEDEEGRPMPPSAEQFAEARRLYLETAAALDLPDDEETR